MRISGELLQDLGWVSSYSECKTKCDKLDAYLPALDDMNAIASMANERVAERFEIELRREEPIRINVYIGAEFDFVRQQWIFTRNRKIIRKRIILLNGILWKSLIESWIRPEDWKSHNREPYYPIMKDLVSTYNYMRFSGSKVPGLYIESLPVSLPVFQFHKDRQKWRHRFIHRRCIQK